MLTVLDEPDMDLSEVLPRLEAASSFLDDVKRLQQPPATPVLEEDVREAFLPSRRPSSHIRGWT